MKNVLQEIVAAEVQRHYKFEKDFYADVLGISQPTWNRWKKGDRGLGEEKMKKVQALFTPYEWMLVQKLSSKIEMFGTPDDTTFFENYIEAKKEIAKTWAELGCPISVNSAQNVSGQKDKYRNPGTEVIIDMGYGPKSGYDSLVFYVNISSAHIKAGKRNRMEWFLKNIDLLQ